MHHLSPSPTSGNLDAPSAPSGPFRPTVAMQSAAISDSDACTQPITEAIDRDVQEAVAQAIVDPEEEASDDEASDEVESTASGDFRNYEQRVLAEIKQSQSRKYSERVDKTIMRSVFLGDSNKYLKFADQKYNIRTSNVSPFMPPERGSNPSLLRELLEKEKIAKAKLWKSIKKKALKESAQQQWEDLGRQYEVIMSPVGSDARPSRYATTFVDDPGISAFNSLSKLALPGSDQRHGAGISSNMHQTDRIIDRYGEIQTGLDFDANQAASLRTLRKRDYVRQFDNPKILGSQSKRIKRALNTINEEHGDSRADGGRAKATGNRRYDPVANSMNLDPFTTVDLRMNASVVHRKSDPRVPLKGASTLDRSPSSPKLEDNVKRKLEEIE